MKTWTYEELYELWRYRGYSKKDSKRLAEKELQEMNKSRSVDEVNEAMRDMMLY